MAKDTPQPELEKLSQAIRQANQEKSQFISVVTHELRTPLTSIKGYADLLRHGAAGSLNEQQLKYLNIIRNNVDRMSELISDLADISHLETGQLRLECAWIPLEPYLEETLRGLQSRLDEKNQSLQVDIASGLPYAYADANRLVQVLANLLDNASKYTPAGGEIRVLARQQEAALRVEVIDTGIGISQQDQVSLFDQFFRSEDPAVREQPGWGLALSVAKRLVALMGGEIGVRSELGQGSAFWFTLPARNPEA